MAWYNRRAPEKKGGGDGKGGPGVIRKVITGLVLLVVLYAMATMAVYSTEGYSGSKPWNWKMDQWKAWTKFAVTFTKDQVR